MKLKLKKSKMSKAEMIRRLAAYAREAIANNASGNPMTYNRIVWIRDDIDRMVGKEGEK